MDGLLVVDKPTGPTSHDLVARLRRLLRERRIGHTGTLDPMASGVLPLVVGKATRLARFMASDEKRYDATVRLGFATDTCDATGRPTTVAWTGGWPDADTVRRALDLFRGTFLQQPPAFSAKKIDGERSYRLARADAQRRQATPPDGKVDDGRPEPREQTMPSPAEVTAFAIDLLDVNEDRVRLHIRCSSGFYVRSLAADLGRVMGVGGHLAALRRTATSGVTLDDAVPLDALESSGPEAAAERLIPIDRMLPALSLVALTDAGADRAATGRDLGPLDATAGFPIDPDIHGPFRLVDAAGHLLGIALRATTPGLLHPAVVLM